MADSCFVPLEGEVFDDQIVPDTDDCFLPPSEPAQLLAGHVPVRFYFVFTIFSHGIFNLSRNVFYTRSM